MCVNGESFRYFKGGRGLRQGDPMSLYLFTMVMEILSLIVEKKVKESDEFKYYFHCEKISLTHVCFADDLLMFCHGDLNSVMEEKHDILSHVPFKVEKILVNYLGVPLSSKRIGVGNCKVLIDKIKNRVLNWKNKCLSYVGRLQLIASVLESIHVYWSSVFLLPQTVIDDINKVFKGFL
ncbi:RNA-directed DNA polymerase, eukaryota, reverse transcriptase zinc-binding domain protein [Tanacetum coccineum]|uniref:RNA-directed DNA polymerase, eukaryota, reverse transcriptase zinc-binding domain protein n=1 Tax=Tanacetum coccineum TaxID=301880 RepID=A0ABQ5H0D6_9ASTR